MGWLMKITAFLLALVCIFLCFASSVSADYAGLVSAKSAVLIDMESGEILYGKGENVRRGMASTTKIMTALIALEHSTPEALVTVHPDACGVEGSSVYLYPEEVLTMETLLYALMLQSANDAAEAIAYEIAGSIEGFAALMNEKARALGLTDTHFENPHGLDGEEHYTTALELAKITAEALRNETFREIVGTVKKAIPLHNGEATRLLVNHNRLLREYDDIIGVKTGYTKACGRTLVSAAERDGITLICVTLDDGNDWQDHRALLDWGFSLYEEKTILEAHEIALDIPVCGGEKGTLRVTNTEALSAFLPNTEEGITLRIELPRFLYGGAEEGEVIGTVRAFRGEREIASLALRAGETVSAVPKKMTLLEKICSLLGIGK